MATLGKCCNCLIYKKICVFYEAINSDKKAQFITVCMGGVCFNLFLIGKLHPYLAV